MVAFAPASPWAVTFHVHLNHLRLERAKQLLRRGDLKINQVAWMCGYRGGRYFSQVFRAATGHTPRSFRAKH